MCEQGNLSGGGGGGRAVSSVEMWALASSAARGQSTDSLPRLVWLDGVYGLECWQGYA